MVVSAAPSRGRTTSPVTRPALASNAGFTAASPFVEGDIGQCLHAAADGGLQTRPADGNPGTTHRVAQLPSAVLEPQEIAGHIAANRTGRFQGIHQPREVIVHHTVAARQEPVCVGGLRNPFAAVGGPGQDVALDDGDAVEVRAQRAGTSNPLMLAPTMIAEPWRSGMSALLAREGTRSRAA